jgi:hypothetical protein
MEHTISILESFRGDASAFQRNFGTHPETFAHLLGLLKENTSIGKRERRGRPRKLNLEQALAMALERSKKGYSLEDLARKNEISTSTAYRTIEMIKSILGKRQICQKGRLDAACAVIVDATETQILRPQKNQRRYFSGKCKRHTVKTEIAITPTDGQIIAISSTVPGAVHDFALFRQKKPFPTDTRIIADSGYQGIAKLCPLSWIPHKKPKHDALDVVELLCNRAHAIIRVCVENILAKIKAFKLLSGRYPNRPAKYNRDFRMVATIVNLESRRPSILSKWVASLRRRIQVAWKYLRDAEATLDMAWAASCEAK